MPDEKKPTAKEQLAERQRCGICGLIHPFLTVCPFVKEHEVRYEYAPSADGQGRRSRTRIERTRYFPRPEIFKALEEATTAADTPPKEKPE